MKSVKEYEIYSLKRRACKSSEEIVWLIRNYKITDGLILVAHEEIRVESGPNDTTYEIVKPQLPKRAVEICNELVDIIGYACSEFDSEGRETRWLYTRETPHIYAGTRFKYLPAKIPLGYEELTEALAQAIQKSEEEGEKVTNTPQVYDNGELNFKEIRDEVEQLWKDLVEKDENNAKLIIEKATEIFGHEVRLSEVTASQVEPFNMLLQEMREMAK